MSVTARQAAADILSRSRDRAGFAGDLIDAYLARNDLSPLDRRFVTQLVFGVIRRRATLDALIAPFVKLPLHAVEARVWDVLQLGAFQLVFLTHVPRHAAVNETVELAMIEPLGHDAPNIGENHVLRLGGALPVAIVDHGDQNGNPWVVDGECGSRP